MWVHDLELGGELSLAIAWEGLVLAREAPFKKGAFLMGERERD